MRSIDHSTFDDAAKQRVRTLAADFPAVWNDPATAHRERKRMIALLLSDVTLIKEQEDITLHVRFRAGATTTLRIPIPLNAWRKRQTHPTALARAEALLRTHSRAEVAATLNEEGFTTGAGAPFDVGAVSWLQQRWGLKTYRDHLLAAGKLTTTDMAKQLSIGAELLREWRRAGRVSATRYNDKGDWLYDPIEQQPQWIQGRAACYAAANINNEDLRSPTPLARGAV